MSLNTVINFSNAGNFTFDASLIEFSGILARLKDLRQSGMTMGMTFTNSVNATWSNGSPTGTPTGAAGVSGGELDLTGTLNKYVTYVATTNFGNTQTGAVKFKYRPNYSGNPSAIQTVFNIIQDLSNINNFMELKHSTGGNWTLECYDSGGSILTGGVMDFGSWAPVSGTQYEVELNFDFTTGATRLFINGVQLGSTKTQTGTRTTTAALIFVGSNYQGGGTPNFKLDDFIIFSGVQHTANYTAGYALTDTIYSLANPSLVPNASFTADGLDGFSVVDFVSGSDQVKHIINFNGQDKYWDGLAWSNSDGTYAQANTAAEIQAHHTDLNISLGGTIITKTLLHSADGSTRPSITSLSIDYNFFAVAPALPGKCYCFLRVTDMFESPVTSAILFVENEKEFWHSGYLVTPYKKQAAANANGYVEIYLAETATPGQPLKFWLTYTDPNDSTTKIINFANAVVPDLSNQDLKDLLVIQ